MSTNLHGETWPDLSVWTEPYVAVSVRQVFSFIILHGFKHDRVCINVNFRLKCSDTVLCISVGSRPHGLETRIIIKILNHPCHPRSFDCFSWDKAKKEKKNEKKNSRIDCWEGHWFGSTDMAVRLSDIRPKTGKKWIFGVF